MPLDNTPWTEFEEDTTILVRAKNLLIEKGWCINTLWASDDRHCAVGAVLAVSGKLTYSDQVEHVKRVIQRLLLAGNMPVCRIDNQISWDPIAVFNNRQTSPEPVLALFDKAIAQQHLISVE